MKRADILETAKNYVLNDRNKEAGEPEDNFLTIGEYWSSYLRRAKNVQLVIQPHDVAAMMTLMKLSRIAVSPAKIDSWIDVAGYAACGGECAANES